MEQTLIMHISALDGTQPWQREYGGLPIRIGRNALNDCRVQHNFISDFHARVEDIDGRICVLDLNSKNGVYVVQPGDTPPLRIAANVPFVLAPYGYEFLLGPTLRMRLELVQRSQPVWGRDPAAFGGSVLGNPKLFGEASPGPQAPGPQAFLPPEARKPTPFPSAHPSPSPGFSPPGFSPPGFHPAPPGSPYEGGALPDLPRLNPVGALPPLSGSPGGGGAFPPDLNRGPRAPSAAPGGYSAVGKSTAHFTMSPEMLALVGLRELAASLVPSQPLETTGDIARFITKIHDSLEMFCRCFIPLREGYAQFVSSMDLQREAMARSRNRSRGYLAVEMARDAGGVAVALLDWRDNSLDAPAAVEGIFADLMLHQVAVLDGVMRGVRALLDQLSPENLEREVGGDKRGLLGNLSGGRYKALWEIYSQRFEELSEENQAFSHIFGPEFTAAYRQNRARRT